MHNLITDINAWYDIYDEEKLIISTQDKASAERRVFAENCSYRNKSDQTWHMKLRQNHIKLILPS